MMAVKLLNPVSNAKALLQVASLIRRHTGLLFAMTERDLRDRFAGTMLGGVWAVLVPLLTMAVYVFVFIFIFNTRLGDDATGIAFTAHAVAGLGLWMALQEGLSRSVNVVSGNANLIKQIVFPSEVLPLKVALATFPTLIIGLLIAIATSAFAGLIRSGDVLLKLPICVACYLLFTSGMAYFFSAIGVFFRDLKDVIAFFLSVGLFLHPILYPPGAAPVWLESGFQLSPISHMIWCFREAIIGPVDPHPVSWAVMPITSLLVFVAGWRTFRWLKPTFGNAL